MFYELTLATALFLLAASFFAGFVDSIAGGGGLIQLPALLIGLPKSGTAEFKAAAVRIDKISNNDKRVPVAGE